MRDYCGATFSALLPASFCIESAEVATGKLINRKRSTAVGYFIGSSHVFWEGTIVDLSIRHWTENIAGDGFGLTLEILIVVVAGHLRWLGIVDTR